MRAPAAFAIIAGVFILGGLGVAAAISLPAAISDTVAIFGVGVLGPVGAYLLVYGGVLERIGFEIER